ncbi:MAG TPA: energy transducer TonB [Gallionellaceae bacterium]
MKLPATKSILGQSPTLQLAMAGSVALHALVLFGLPAPAAGAHAPTTTLEARLEPAPRHEVAATTAPRATPTTIARDSIPVDAPAIQPTAAPPQTVAQADSAANDTPAASSSYFDAAQLDVPPHLLGELQQVYPARARVAAVEGYVTLALLINERGEVEDVSVVRAQPAGYFEEAALNMLRKQRFSPPIKQNRAVKSRWLTTVRYRLQS